MAEPANAFEPEDRDAKKRAIQEARQQISEGKAVPHERVAPWLRELGNGIRKPAPK